MLTLRNSENAFPEPCHGVLLLGSIKFSAGHDRSASLAQEVNREMYFRVLVRVIVRILEEAHSLCCYCTFRRLDCDAELFFPGAL